MGSRLMPNGRWRIILGHGPDRRYVYCDSWEKAEKVIRCERTEAKVRDAKRSWGQAEEAEKQKDEKIKAEKVKKPKSEKPKRQTSKMSIIRNEVLENEVECTTGLEVI